MPGPARLWPRVFSVSPCNCPSCSLIDLTTLGYKLHFLSPSPLLLLSICPCVHCVHLPLNQCHLLAPCVQLLFQATFVHLFTSLSPSVSFLVPLQWKRALHRNEMEITSCDLTCDSRKCSSVLTGSNKVDHTLRIDLNCGLNMTGASMTPTATASSNQGKCISHFLISLCLKYHFVKRACWPFLSARAEREI